MLAIKVEGIGEDPKVEIEVERSQIDGKIKYTVFKLGELVVELDWKKLDEIGEKIDFALWDETKEDLENKVEDLELQISRLKERIDEVATTHEESDNIWINSEQ